jgi:hypothetical protein
MVVEYSSRAASVLPVLRPNRRAQDPWHGTVRRLAHWSVRALAAALTVSTTTLWWVTVVS